MDVIIVVTLGVAVAVVVGLVQVFKLAGVSTRFAPLLSVAFGLLIVLGLSFFQATFTVIVTGLVVGLTACGLYSGVKTSAGL